jgi:hypothetical protein
MSIIKTPNIPFFSLGRQFWGTCIQGVFEMRAEILTTSYWLHVELGKNI